MATFNVPYHMRNAEEVHNAMLQEAKEYHDNLRKQAELVLAKHLLDESLAVVKWEHEQREDIIRLQTEITLEKKKIQDMGLSALEAEAELKESERKTAAARIKLQVLTDDVDALKKKITTPPPASTPAPAAASVNPPAATLNPVPTPATQQRHPAALPTIQVIDQPGEASQELSDPMTPPAKPPAKPTLLRPNVRPAAPSGPSAADTQATSTPQPAPPTQPAPSTQQAPPAQPAPPAPTTAKYTFEGARSFLSGMVDEPNTQKYVSIHMNSKRLRNQVKPKGKENTTPLKDIAMKQSSAIRIAMGQLSGVGKNSAIYTKLRDIMIHAFTFKVAVGNEYQVLMMDPAGYVVRVPEPLTDPNAKNNGDQLPVLFIYLLSVFSKALVAQAAQEAAQKPESAEPIALAAHHIFSHPDLLWRGTSMIDMLIAKLRKSCGALFGFRGNENTEEGRVTLGWKKEDGNWIAEQFHYDRMRGIGAFYAGLTLRVYKNRVNPYPPHNYWRAMASMLACPQQERSNTSYYIIGALIQGYEQKFLVHYGDMARAALEAALVEYPRGAWDPKNVAVVTLITLGEKIQKNGLHLPE